LLDPITIPDIGFVITPPLSPSLIGATVIMLCAGIAKMSTLTCDGIAVIGNAVSGLGIGVGQAGKVWALNRHPA